MREIKPDSPDGLTWFCWSALEENKHADNFIVTHLQGQHVNKEDVTACGIATDGGWQFNVAASDDPGKYVSCKRCAATYRKLHEQ